MTGAVPEPLGDAAYAEQVRQELAKLPGALAPGLLADLDEHLAEVSAESVEPLEARLGSPADYARELHGAADLPSRASRPAPESGAAELPQVRPQPESALADVLAFLAELRPAWWVLRAWLAANVLFALSGRGVALLPFGKLLGLPVLAAATVLSVRLGRWSRSRPAADRRRLIGIAGNVALGLSALLILGAVQRQDTGPVYAGPNPVEATQTGTLARQDGTAITDIYPYSSTGQPLRGVLLYDQDGRALDNLATVGPDGSPVGHQGLPGARPVPANSFPRDDLQPGPLPTTAAPIPTSSPTP